MGYSKFIISWFICFAGVFSERAEAQNLNINGDTLFLNLEAEVQIVFPSVPVSYSTVPAATQYRIWDVKTGIYLIPGRVDYTPATLQVSEGGRQHRFVLVFKQEISNKEAKLYYDYSTVKKLAQHLRLKPLVPITTTKPAKQVISIETPVETIRPDTSTGYYSFLEQGEKQLRLQNYQEALLSFNKAHGMRPSDPFPVQRVADIKVKIAENEKWAEKEKNYATLTSAAKTAFDQKKYGEALLAYKQALQLKPGDGLAAGQVQAISGIIVEQNARKQQVPKSELNDAAVSEVEKIRRQKQLADENNYRIAIESADNFFKNGKYDSARALYNAALIFSKRDWPVEQIKFIDKILNDHVLPATPQNARVFKPTLEKVPVPKPDTVSIQAETNQTDKTDANYELNIHLADSLVNAKSFEAAITFYEAASALKPLESYPVKQLKYMKSELALLEKRKKEDNERRYRDALERADKAATNLKYDDAIAGYIEALIVHPENEYAKKRLEIITYQVEKARLQKLKQGSVKQAEPVKTVKKQ